MGNFWKIEIWRSKKWSKNKFLGKTIREDRPLSGSLNTFWGRRTPYDPSPRNFFFHFFFEIFPLKSGFFDFFRRKRFQDLNRWVVSLNKLKMIKNGKKISSIGHRKPIRPTSPRVSLPRNSLWEILKVGEKKNFFEELKILLK